MTDRIICQGAVDLIKFYEGILDGDKSTANYDAYLDPIGIWTIGWGHALRGADGHFLKGEENRANAKAQYPNGLTLAEAEALLRDDLTANAKSVLAMVTVDVTDNELGGLTSFAFNVGIGNLRTSTLLKKLNAGDKAGAADQFLVWNRAGGQVLAGLTKRRASERELFLKP